MSKPSPYERVLFAFTLLRRTTSLIQPEALMFPTFGRGERTGQKVPRHAKNFLKWRIYPITDKLKIPRKLVTFQVMPRTLGTDLQEHGTMKDAQTALRHASVETTANVYMQPIPAKCGSGVELTDEGSFVEKAAGFKNF